MCTRTGTVGMFNLMMFISVNYQTPVIVNDPAVLTCNQPCSGNIKWMFSKRPEMLVSECKRGTYAEGYGFKNRTRLMLGNPSLHLDPVMYNDNGWYICSCNNTEICEVHLEVVFPNRKSVCVGDNVAIPCYANTDKSISDNDIKVQWKKDGKVVVKLQQGKMSYGPGFEGRGFITASQYRNGDLSLSIHKVQQSDGGIYGCMHRHEEPGEPVAIILQISECNAVVQSIHLSWWGNLLLVIVLSVFIGRLFYTYCKGRCMRP